MASPTIDRRLGLTGNKAYKAPADLATTGNITLSGEQTIDGTLTDESRVVVWVQTNPVDNGVWDTGTGAWSRAIDCNTNQDIANGTQILVSGGTAYANQIFEFTSANPIIPGTSSITIAQSPSSSSALTRLASTASASDNAGLINPNFNLSYTAGTLGRALTDRVWSVTDYPWLAVGNDSTDNYAAILAAQTALSAAGGGTLLIPRGTFRITTAIPRVTNVDYMGLGWASILKPVACGAFTYAFTTGFGRSQTRNMWIQGSSGTTQIGIYQAGTLNDADELYGLLIDGCAITGFNTAMQFRTLRNFTITNNWIQDVNSGIKLIGKCLVGRIQFNDIVKAAGSGTGTAYGVLLNGFNYTSGTGIVTPEGIRINANQVQGFEYCNDIQAGVEVRITNPDYTATRIGIRFSSVVSFSADDGYVQVDGSLGEFAIHGPAQAAVNNSKYRFRGLKLIATNVPAGTAGIMLGTRTVSGNVDGVSVEDCEFAGWTTSDIECFSSGNNQFIRNRCLSSGTTQSILVGSIPAGRPVVIDQNDCAKLIQYEASAFYSGILDLRTNVISGSTINSGRAQPTTPTFAAGDYTANGTMTWTVGSGDIVTCTHSFNGKLITMLWRMDNTTVGGSLNTQLRIAIPGGLLAAKGNTGASLLIEAGTSISSYSQAIAGLGFIVISKIGGANFASATDTTSLQGSITFEVA